MVPASPISGIMCDHYPVPPITTRPQVRVSKTKKKKKGGERCFVRENVCVSEPSGKGENEEWRTVCARVARLCVRCGPPHAPPCCHSIHPVISNYCETQVFATPSLSLPDLICSTPSVNQPLTRWSTVRHGPRFSSRICRRGLRGIITCIRGREHGDSKWIFYYKKRH